MVVGGLTNNILAPHYVEKEHAEKVSQFISQTRNISTLFVFRFLIPLPAWKFASYFGNFNSAFSISRFCTLLLPLPRCWGSLSNSSPLTGMWLRILFLIAEFTRFSIRHLFPPAGQLELPSRYVWWQVYLSPELEITKPNFFNETFYNSLDPAFSALQEYSSWGVALERERKNLLLFLSALMFEVRTSNCLVWSSRLMQFSLIA